MLVQVIPDRFFLSHGAIHIWAAGWILFIRVDQNVQGELIESDDVEQHPPHPKRQNVSGLAENRSQTFASPFKCPVIPRDPKGHVSRLSRNVQVL